MKIVSLPISGCCMIEPDWFVDQRGQFARTYCRNEFAQAGIEFSIVQTSLSVNPQRGTLRGIHFQAGQWAEGKLVRCESGKIYDVMVDLRPESETFRQWHAEYLCGKEGRQLFLPKGIGHGFLTMEQDTVVSYAMSTEYHPKASRGLNYLSESIAITWPSEIKVISDKDKHLPSFDEILPNLKSDPPR